MGYVKGSIDLVMVYSLSAKDLEHMHLAVCVDSDWAGDKSTTRSTSGLFCRTLQTWCHLHR